LLILAVMDVHSSGVYFNFAYGWQIGKRPHAAPSFSQLLSDYFSVKVINQVKVTLRLPVSQSESLGIEHPCGTCDQVLLPLGRCLPQSCCLVSMGRPL
jgi:hypothetical protein